MTRYSMVLLCCVAASFANAQELCSDIKDAFYNKYQINSARSVSAAARSWICSDNFLSDIKKLSSGSSISIPILGSYDGTKSNESFFMKRDQFCQNSSYNFTEDEAYAIFSQTVDKVVVEAWAKCMSDRNRRFGNSVISLEEEVNDESIFVTAKFRITVDGLRDKHALITNFFSENAQEVKGEWSKGTEVTIQGVVHHFRRIDPNKPVIIKLLTTQGVSDNLVIKAKEYPAIIGNIQATWEEPYQGEAEPQEVGQERTTGDHHCESDCEGEPTRTNYTLKLEPKSNGVRLTASDGYLKDLKFQCMEGNCGGWNEVKEVRLLNKVTGYASWDVWTRPTRWRLSGKWVYYTEKWKYGSSSERQLKRGDQIILVIPSRARNVRIFGETPNGAFEYTWGTIKSTSWLKYRGNHESWGRDYLTFEIARTPY